MGARIPLSPSLDPSFPRSLPAWSGAARKTSSVYSPRLRMRGCLEANLPLSKLLAKGAPFTVEQWLKSLDLAPKTKGNIRNVMAVIFNCAMRWGIIELGTNPLSLVRVKGISRRQAEPRILAANKIQALIAALPMDPYRTTVGMALTP